MSPLARASDPARSLGLPRAIRQGVRGVGDIAGLSPFWDWKTLESEHFRITFPAELADTAQRVAHHYEEAHRLLSPLLKWEPADRAQVVLVDNSDLANGFSTPVARIGMVLIVTPPESYFSTAYYDDWLRLLVIHEYTHYLNMDTARSFYKVFRFLFGPVLLPNSLWPSWMLEGLAVYDETRFTSAGRGRSPYYEMVLRTAVAEGALDDKQWITLDRVNGSYPWPPGGETAYLFGYELMNQAARQNKSGIYAGDAALGEMSYRSGKRFPYLINGNVSNITGKDWYELWANFVAETRERMTEALARIRSQPVTKLEPLSSPGHTESGVAVSPDGRWLAYSQDTSDRRMGLYLRDLKSGENRRMLDKILGGTLSFSPDSKHLFYSSVRKQSEYLTYSDLAVLDVERGSWHWLTEGLRARDPSVSPDGKRLAYTIVEGGTVGLALSELRDDGGRIELEAVTRAYAGAKYSRVGSPVFSRDGKEVFFSLHENGRAQEDLLVWDLAARKSRKLLSDGKFNRHLALDPKGALIFVSDRTGVDNVYRLRRGHEPEAMSNVVSGLAFPAYAPDGQLFVNAYSSSGWQIARAAPLASPLDGASLKAVSVPPSTAPSPAPGSPEKTEPGKALAEFPVEDYSVWPSILPRQWYFLPTLYDTSAYFTAQAAGFDAVDRHRYLLIAGYDTIIPTVDWLVAYENRQLGPTITLSASNETSGSSRSGSGKSASLIYYDRTLDFSATVSHPFLWTYSSLTPFVGFNSERTRRYVPGFDPSNEDLHSTKRFVPSVDLFALYSDAESSRLAIAPEGGRSTLLGARRYFDPSASTWKLLFSDSEYLRITDHAILSPSLTASMSSPGSPYYEKGNVVLQGRYNRIVNSLPGQGFSEIGIRGYPARTFYVRKAAVAALDFKYPIFRVFRGWGTNPLFLENIYGLVFGESTYVPEAIASKKLLPSVGAGLRADLELLIHIPLILSVEYHRGFAQEAGGRGQLFFQLGLGALAF